MEKRQKEDVKIRHSASPVQPGPGLKQENPNVEVSSLARIQWLRRVGLRKSLVSREENSGHNSCCVVRVTRTLSTLGLVFLKVYSCFYVGMCLCTVCVTHECRRHLRPEEATEAPGAAAIGSCEFSYMSPGKGPQVLCNHWATSPARVLVVFLM